MEFIEFNGMNVRIAEDQPEYGTIPAYHDPKKGSVTFVMQFSKEEIDIIKRTGKVLLQQFTGGKPMQPILPTVWPEQVLPAKMVAAGLFKSDSVVPLPLPPAQVESIPIPAKLKTERVVLGKGAEQFKLNGVMHNAQYDAAKDEYYYERIVGVSISTKK